MRNKLNINPGDSFNLWTVIKEVEKTTARNFLCRCKCGTEKIIRIDGLVYGHSKGCYHCANKNTKHKDTGSRLHRIWMGIVNRCRFKKEYQGIQRCSEWDDYIIFKNWAMANGYNESLTIDRIDGTKGYYPDNCRWVTPQIQAENQKLLTKQNTSGYKGVCFREKTNRWRATIRIRGKAIEIGSTYKSVLEAAIAYDTYIINNNLIERKLNVLVRK